eukprot:7633445-Pyramimonas_sp.AAC.1
MSRPDSRSRTPTGPRAWHATSQAERDSGSQLLQLMIKLYATCKISAKDFCSLCWHAHGANVAGGDFGMYAKDPSSQSGKFQHHLDEVLPQPKFLYPVSTPVNFNRRPERTLRDVLMRCPCESLAEEISTDPLTMSHVLSPPGSRTSSVMDAPVYYNHPLVTAARDSGHDLPVPIAIYLDG